MKKIITQKFKQMMNQYYDIDYPLYPMFYSKNKKEMKTRKKKSAGPYKKPSGPIIPKRW